MELFNSGRPITDNCPGCGRALDANVRPRRKISGFLRLILSLGPGLGHMYMGLLHRGMHFMIGTALLVAVMGMIMGGWALFAIFGLVALSVFDAREAHLRLEQGLEVEDRGIVNVQNLTITWNHRYFAYVLIGVGALILYAQVVRPALAQVFQRSGMYYYWANQADSALFAVIIMGLGIWMLRRQMGKH